MKRTGGKLTSVWLSDESLAILAANRIPLVDIVNDAINNSQYIDSRPLLDELLKLGYINQMEHDVFAVSKISTATMLGICYGLIIRKGAK